MNGIIQRNTLALIYGPSGCGKSFLALDLAHHLALGQPWFGHEVDERAGVLYIAAEASGGIVKRVKAFRQHHEIAKDAYCPLWFIRAPVNLLNPATVDDMEITWAAWANQFEVIVVDTLSRCIPGGAENQPEVMTAAVDTLDRIRQRTDATIIVVHHSPLSDKDRPRGHSSLYAASDTAITIEQTGDIRTACLRYQRDGEEGARFAFTLKQLEIGQDKHLRPITSCVVREAEASASTRTTKLTSKNRQALDKLTNCLLDLGQPAPASSHIPEGVTVVSLDQWRENLERASIINRDGNPRQQFARIKDALREKQAIGIWDDLVWDARP